MCLLWTYHFCNDNTEACNEIWRNYLQKNQEILCHHASVILRIRNDSKLLSKFENLLDKTEIGKRTLGAMYSRLIENYLNDGDNDQATDTLERALKFVSLKDISKYTLQKLELIRLDPLKKKQTENTIENEK